MKNQNTINLFEPTLGRAEFALQRATETLTTLGLTGRIDPDVAAVISAVVDAVGQIAGVVARIDLEMRTSAP